MVLTEEIIYKRLRQVGDTQESIGTLSTWVFHHQDKMDMIVECWLNSFRTANEELRVSLFYLMNDVVQKSVMKSRNQYAIAFQPAIITAIKLGRANDKVHAAIKKVLNIFKERKIYSEEVIENMMVRLAETDEEVIDIDVKDLQAKIISFDRAHQCFEKGCSIIKKGKFRYEDLIPYKMRTRVEATSMLTQSQDAIAKIDSFIEAAQIRHQRAIELVELLELSIRYFASELRDATTAEDAYQQFHKGMIEVKCELERMLATGTYPSATPPKDAPSPTPQDDIYARGVEEVLNSMRAMQKDNNEIADMEIGDDDSAPMTLCPAVSISMHTRMHGHRNLASTSKAAPYSTNARPAGNDPRNMDKRGHAPPNVTPDISRPPPLIPSSSALPTKDENSTEQPLSLRNKPLTFENIRGLLERVKNGNPTPPPNTEKNENSDSLVAKIQEPPPPGVSPAMLSPVVPSVTTDAVNPPGTSGWVQNNDYSMPPPIVPFNNGASHLIQVPNYPPPALPISQRSFSGDSGRPPTYGVNTDVDLRPRSNEDASYDHRDSGILGMTHSIHPSTIPIPPMPHPGPQIGDQSQRAPKGFLQNQEPFVGRPHFDGNEKNYSQPHYRYDNRQRQDFHNEGGRGRPQQNFGQRSGSRGHYNSGGRNRGNDYNNRHGDRDRGHDGGYKRRRDNSGEEFNRQGDRQNTHDGRGNRGYRGRPFRRGNFDDRRNFDNDYDQSRQGLINKE